MGHFESDAWVKLHRNNHQLKGKHNLIQNTEYLLVDELKEIALKIWGADNRISELGMLCNILHSIKVNELRMLCNTLHLVKVNKIKILYNTLDEGNKHQIQALYNVLMLYITKKESTIR